MLNEVGDGDSTLTCRQEADAVATAPLMEVRWRLRWRWRGRRSYGERERERERIDQKITAMEEDRSEGTDWKEENGARFYLSVSASDGRKELILGERQTDRQRIFGEKRNICLSPITYFFFFWK